MPDLLWVDDDGPGMFLFEVFQLEELGWTVHFTTHIEGAAEALRSRDFDAVLLDQMMPLAGGTDQPVDVWAGCLVLWWLRHQRPPGGAPAASIEATQVLWKAPPRAANTRAPALVVSAFDDPEVDAEIQAVLPGPEGIDILVKPVEAAALLERLAALRAQAADTPQ